MKKHISYVSLALGMAFGLFSVAEAKSAQGVVQEIWTTIKGGTVSELTENKRYARTSNKVRILDEFADADLGEEYGSRYSALLIPPRTGNYTFWIAADDTAELWLSTDEDPSNLRKVISLNRYSGERKWTRNDQKSSVVQLKKGNLYFIRALHKQGGSGNHFSVAWQGPGFEQKVIRATSLEIPPLDKRTLELGKKTRLAEQRTAKILKTLKTISPNRTEDWVGKLNKTERIHAAEALLKLGQTTKKNPSPKNLAKIKPYAAKTRKLMPSPESPVSDPVLKALLVLENIYIQALPKAKLQSRGAHRTAAVFGQFPAGTKPINKTVTLHSKEDKSRGELLSTGLYALPGKPFTITIPQWLVGQKTILQIGHHLDANKHNKAFECMPKTTRKIVLTQKTTKAVNPYGGMLFINIPKKVALDETTLSFSGIIESPRFVLGQTTDAAWKTIRNHPGPWGELVGNHIIFVVHREALQALDNPTALMTWWDGNVQAHEGFYNYDIGIPLRIHTCFNPIMGFSTWPLYEKKASIPNLLNLQRMKAYNSGLFLHEHGHHCDDGRMMFGKIGESTPNWAGYYMKGTRGDFTWKDTEETHMLRLFDPTDDLHQKLFTDGWWTTEWSHLWSYPLTSIMIGYAQAFGWEAFKTTVHRFTLSDDEINQLPAYSNRNRSDQDKMDLWLIFLSQEAKHDVRPYFAHFHITESETAGELIDKMRLPKWDAVYNPTHRVIASQNQPITLTSPLENALTYSKDLSITWPQRPAHGKLSSKNDTLTYIPEPGFTGKVDLPYSIKNSYGNESKGSIEIHIVPENTKPKLAIGTIGGISTKNWTAIPFPHRYAKPVVVASIDPEANPDFIVRIRNVQPTGCEIKLQSIRDHAKNGNTHDASWVVMESGVFTAAKNGIVAEAGTVQTTPEKTSKEVEGVRKIFGENISKLRSACFGQVQTVNNPEWNSFFWRSDPDNLGVRVGSHLGTADHSREKETVGYIFISPGIYQFGNTVVTIGTNQIESEGTVLRTGFDCFNSWGFGKTARHFAQ